MFKKSLILTLLFFSVIFSLYSNDLGEFYSDKEVTKCVCSTKGLSVWSEPSFDSEKIGALNNYKIVKVFGRSKELETIELPRKFEHNQVEPIENYWFLIGYNDAFGWVLGHFLADNLEEAKEIIALNGDWCGDKITKDESAVPNNNYPFSLSYNTISINFLCFKFDQEAQQYPYYEFDWNGETSVGDLSLSYDADIGGGGISKSVYYKDGVLYGSYSASKRSPCIDEDGEFNPYGNVDVDEHYVFSYAKRSNNH